jgi:hypothetical protein
MSSISPITSWCAFVASNITMVGTTNMVKVGPSRRLDPIEVMVKPGHHAGLVLVIADRYSLACISLPVQGVPVVARSGSWSWTGTLYP